MNAKQIYYDLDIRKHQDAYDEMLGDTYGTVWIGELEFSPADILRELDPTAYRCGFNDWVDSQPEIWECGECGEEFDNEHGAELCCREIPVCADCAYLELEPNFEPCDTCNSWNCNFEERN